MDIFFDEVTTRQMTGPLPTRRLVAQMFKGAKGRVALVPFLVSPPLLVMNVTPPTINQQTYEQDL
jgi:hypothetical protein